MHVLYIPVHMITKSCKESCVDEERCNVLTKSCAILPTKMILYMITTHFLEKYVAATLFTANFLSCSRYMKFKNL